MVRTIALLALCLAACACADGGAVTDGPGLTLRYYEASIGTVLDIAGLTPARTETVASFGIPEWARDDDFALELFGAIDIPADGEYTFYTESDDGSLLAIGEDLVVRSDWPHGAVEASGTVTLTAGKHPIWVGYFEGAVDQALRVSWSGPGFAQTEIAPEALSQAKRAYRFPEGGVSTTRLEWPEIGQGFTLRIDTRAEPKLAILNETIPQVLQEEFPTMWETLGTERTHMPETVKVLVRPGIDPPAYASGPSITLKAEHFLSRPGDLGCLVHELAHIVQSYPRSRVDAGWLVEGVADYVRYQCAVPDGWSIPKEARAGTKWTDGYWVTASFLVFVELAYDPDIAKAMNEALSSGSYRTELWKERTGRPLEELWADYMKRWGHEVREEAK